MLQQDIYNGGVLDPRFHKFLKSVIRLGKTQHLNSWTHVYITTMIRMFEAVQKVRGTFTIKVYDECLAQFWEHVTDTLAHVHSEGEKEVEKAILDLIAYRRF